MPQPLYPPTGPQTIGQVLDTGFRIFQVSLVRCLLYGAAGIIAGQLPNIYSVLANKSLGTNFRDPAWLSLYVVSVLVSIIIYGALILRQYSIVTGRRRGMRAELAEALRRFPSIFGVSLVGFAMAAVLLVFTAAITGALAMPANIRVIVIIVGLLALIPIAYFLVPYSFALPSVIVDGRRALASLRYGFMLVKGSWWRTSVIYTVLVIVVVAFYVVATIVAGVLTFSVGGADVVAMSASWAVMYVALGAIGMPFTTATVLATFGELKVRREAVDLEVRLGEVARS